MAYKLSVHGTIFPITGYKPHKQFIRAFGMIKFACGKANLQQGMLQKDIADAIIRASSEVIQGKFDEEFIVDVIQGGAGTSMNMNANEVIANRAIEILGGKKGDYSIVSPYSHVNMAQSTNDTFPTAFKIAALTLVKKLLII